MKKIFLLGILSLLLMGNGKIEYSKDVYIKNNKMYKKSDKSLYTGNVYKTFKSGTKEVQYINGEKTGNEKIFYLDGKLKAEKVIKDGISYVKIYYPNGKLAFEETIDKSNGIEKIENKYYYKNGNIKSETKRNRNIKSDRLISVYNIEYTISGEIKKKYIDDGNNKITQKVLEKKDIETYEEYTKKDSKYIGKYISYKDGALKQELIYDENGNLTEESKVYNESGEVQKNLFVTSLNDFYNKEITDNIINISKSDTKNKYQLEYEDKNGNLHKDIISKDFYLDSGVKYNDYGLVELEEPSKNNKAEGVFKRYKNGLLVSEKFYKDGFQEKKKDYWLEFPNNEYIISEYIDVNSTKTWYPNGKLRSEEKMEGENIIEKRYAPNGELAYERFYKPKKEVYTIGKELIDEKQYLPKYFSAVEIRGNCEVHFSNGKLAFRGTYDKGKRLIGDTEMYREDGSPVYKIKYEKNKFGHNLPTDIKIYYPNGNLKYERILKNDVITLEKSYYEDGKTMYLDIRDENGKTKTEERYYPNGKLAGKTFYIDEEKQIKDGEYLRYYPNGNLKIAGNYKDGILVGEYKEYYSNGNLKSSINYDTLEGTTYYRDNKLKTKSISENNSNVNNIYSYYTNGKLKSKSYYDTNSEKIKNESYYLNGNLKTSDNIIYYSNGNIKEKKISNDEYIKYYINGQIMEEKTLDKTIVYDEDGQKISEEIINKKENIFSSDTEKVTIKYYVTGDVETKTYTTADSFIIEYYDYAENIIGKESNTYRGNEITTYNDWEEVLEKSNY